MPKITSFLLSIPVEFEAHDHEDNEPVTVIVAPQSTLLVKKLPVERPFCMNLIMRDFPRIQTMSLRCEISNPDGEIIQTLKNLPLPLSELDLSSLPYPFRGFDLQIEVRGLTFREEGFYNAEFFLDEEPLGAFEIPVCLEHNSRWSELPKFLQ